jgi:hypothetical protein
MVIYTGKFVVQVTGKSTVFTQYGGWSRGKWFGFCGGGKGEADMM